MIILSREEYLEALAEMETLIRPGYENISHEDRQRFDELNEATGEWEEKNMDDFVKDALNSYK